MGGDSVSSEPPELLDASDDEDDDNTAHSSIPCFTGLPLPTRCPELVTVEDASDDEDEDVSIDSTCPVSDPPIELFPDEDSSAMPVLLSTPLPPTDTGHAPESSSGSVPDIDITNMGGEDILKHLRAPTTVIPSLGIPEEISQ
jgi:hypothetical protein